MSGLKERRSDVVFQKCSSLYPATKALAIVQQDDDGVLESVLVFAFEFVGILVQIAKKEN